MTTMTMTNDTMTADRAREILDAFFGPCDECDGAGHYLCPNCGDDPGESCDEEHDGARHVTCDECDGRGYVRDSDVGDPSDDDTHAQLASVIALHAQLAQVTAERDALRAIVEGRTTPPSDEEIAAHDGPWLVVLDHRAGHVSRVVCGDSAAELAAQQRAQCRAWVWHPFDERVGAIVACPVVGR